MPPSFRLLPWFRPQAQSRSSRWLFPLLPLGLLAIALGGGLVAWRGQRIPAVTTLQPVAPSTAKPWGSSLLHRFYRQPRPSTPLAVPPPVLPHPLPPPQAWPELPLVKVQPSFTDLDPGYWAWPLLADLARRDLVAGFPDGSFRPGEPMTRAEFAAQLTRLFDLPQELTSPPGSTPYPDMATDHWAYDSVQKSVQMGFLTGYPEGTVLPEQTVTRIQVIVALANGLRLKSSRGAAPLPELYGDQNQVPDWANRQLVAATAAGLVVNYPDLGQLAPNRPATRAEVAAMLHRALVYTGRLQEVPFAYVVKAP